MIVLDQSGGTPLHWAGSAVDLWFCQALCVVGADINAISKYGRTALKHATHSDHRDTTVALLEAGADPNLGPIPPIYWAARAGYVGVVDTLCRYGAEIDRQSVDGGMAVMAAVEYNRKESLQYLIDRGARLNILKDGNRPALQYAA